LNGGLSFNLIGWCFDGGAEKNRLAEAQADVRAAKAETNARRNQIADEVWTAYSNLNTAFRQRQAAIALSTLPTSPITRLSNHTNTACATYSM